MATLTANEQMLDALVRHQIGLLRVGTGVQAKIVALLDETERELRDLIISKTGRLTGRSLTETVTQGRLKALLAEVREIRSRAISNAWAGWRDELRDLIKHEAEYISNAVQVAAPMKLDLVSPEPAVLNALVTTTPFQGQVLGTWARKLQRDDLHRISSAIQTGMVRGETTTNIAARVVGNASLRGANGVTQITRNEAESITRTAIQAYANAARNAVFNANSDIFTKERYVATLDSKTTPMCRALDGRLFKRGEGPQPPIHWRCRSLRVPFIDPSLAGSRPARRGTEQQALRDFTDQKGLARVGSRSKLPHGTKGEFDAFLTQRMRQLTGQVPANTTYQTFLTRQSASFQDDVLGKARGALFRRGGLTLDRFVDNSGRQLTLRELALREANAFKRAGLDPDEFISGP